MNTVDIDVVVNNLASMRFLRSLLSMSELTQSLQPAAVGEKTAESEMGG